MLLTFYESTVKILFMDGGKNRKWKPEHSLLEIKRLVSETKRLYSKSVRLEDLGYTSKAADAVLLSLKQTDFRSSNEDWNTKGQWFDVYVTISEELEIYIKLKIVDELLIVTSFKENTGGRHELH